MNLHLKSAIIIMTKGMNKEIKDRWLDDQVPDIIRKAGKRNPFSVPDGYFDTVEERIMAAVESAPAESRRPAVVYQISRKWRAVAAAAAIILLAGFTYALITEVILPAIAEREEAPVEHVTQGQNNTLQPPDALSGNSEEENTTPDKHDLRTSPLPFSAGSANALDPTSAGNKLPFQSAGTSGKIPQTQYGSSTSQQTGVYAPSGVIPASSLLRDTILCKGAIISYYSGYNPAEYQINWQLNGKTVASASPNNGQNLTLYTSQLSCGTHLLSLQIFEKSTGKVAAVANASIIVVESPNIKGERSVCGYEKAVLRTGARNPYWTYQWSTGEGAHEITVTRSGKYWVTIGTTGSSCSISDTFEVTIMPRPTLSLGADRTICGGDQITFRVKNPDGQYQLNWTPGNSHLPEYRFTGNQPGMYRIRVELTGCTTISDEVVIHVTDCSIEIPNVFTPNGDGRNDRFVIKGLENHPGSKLLVTDRNGQVVFESSDYNNNWDGGDHPNGTYYYILYPGGAAESYRKGTVMILR